jgi:hypothetical protein
MSEVYLRPEPSLIPIERPRCPKCQGRMMLTRTGQGALRDGVRFGTSRAFQRTSDRPFILIGRVEDWRAGRPFDGATFPVQTVATRTA